MNVQQFRDGVHGEGVCFPLFLLKLPIFLFVWFLESIISIYKGDTQLVTMLSNT